MNTEVFDAIIVGAGQAGPTIAVRCSREGPKTAVIERHHFGGTCGNDGCVPTKTLKASARADRLVQRGSSSASTWPTGLKQGHPCAAVPSGGCTLKSVIAMESSRPVV